LFGWERDHFAELEQLQRQMNRLIGSAFGMGRARGEVGVFPALNLSEDQDNLYVRAELPGVALRDVEITTHDNNLIVKGERKIAAEGENVSYHRRERESGSFRRIVSLPSRVATDKVSAVLKNGVLTVTLPKAAEAKPRKIEVSSA
jgi:HSP20 family protein